MSKSKSTTDNESRFTINEATIKVLAKHNPKRPKSRAHSKFGVLMRYNGKKVRDFKAQEGRHSKLDVEKRWPATELRWARKQGLVKITNNH